MLFIEHLLERLALFQVFHVASAKPVHTVLRIIAIHYHHALARHVMEVTGKQHRHGGLAHAALLVAEGDKERPFVHTLSSF